MKNHIVLGAGLIAVDHIFLAERKKTSSRYIGSAGGGSVSNVLTMMSLLGHECYIFGVLGNDSSRFIAEKEFKEYGINYNNVVVRGNIGEIVGTRQYSHMIYGNNEHSYLEKCTDCGASFGKHYQISKDDVSKKLLNLSFGVNVFVVDRANTATITLARNVKSKNGFVAYDLNFVSYGKYADNIRELLGQSDLVKTDVQTLKQLMKYSQTGDVNQWKHEYPNIKYLFVTDSNRGVDCYFSINEKGYSIHRDAIKNENVKDTGGAGDVFLAVLIHQLTDDKNIVSVSDFEKIIDRAQALASLNCSLYGSRALQRFLLNNRMSNQDIMNNAEDIRAKGKIDSPLNPNIGLPKPSIKPYLLTSGGICPVCGSERERRIHNKENTDSDNISFNQMAKTLSGLPNAMFSGFEASLSYRGELKNLFEKSAIFVGSGGSFSASTFGEYLYMKGKGIMAKAITPYELEGWERIPKNVCVWLISHGGFNTDILGAALHLEELKWHDVIVVTGSKSSALAELADSNRWALVLTSATERNFVSTIGLLTQISALSALLSSDSELNELKEYFNYEILNKRLKEYFIEAQGLVATVGDFFVANIEPHIIAFARGWSWPALTDLESKVIEGGICTIEISELKNYTHGRWMNLYGRDNRILTIYETPEDQELIDFFEKKFKRIPTISIRTKNQGMVGSIDLMLKTLLVANFLGKLAKKNILKPKFPKQGRGLYSWEPDSRKGRWKRALDKPRYREEEGLNQRTI